MNSTNKRANKCVERSFELVIVGGGLSGVCCAIAAAREGISVGLIQDRPVLGGNASSEIRVWALGATSHMGNNNRWAREGGIIDEIMVENTFRNREGNPLLFDALLLEKVLIEQNISLYLNSVVFDTHLNKKGKIESISAFNPQNSTQYIFSAPLFCDASGDGIIGYMSGALYHVGTADESQLKEKFLPSKEYGEVLGHTIFFYPKRTDNAVKYIAPEFALKNIGSLPKINQITPEMSGCNYWWFEYGGNKDTIHDSEEIKMKLWSVIYGAWDHIKNSGQYPEAENMTLEWVGTITGKRESRRFEGLYMLKQEDIIEQHIFDDAVSYGGWAIDLHPADGIFSAMPSCNQYHSKGIYSIPYRCFVSKNIDNLFVVGRLISVSHVAFGSTRVMITSAHGGQAVGVASALCIEKGCSPCKLMDKENMHQLQQRLSLQGQSIPHVPIAPSDNLLNEAFISASGTLAFNGFSFDGEWKGLNFAIAELLPLEKDVNYTFEFEAKASRETTLQVELAVAEKKYNYTPQSVIEKKCIKLKAGVERITISFDKTLPTTQYAFVIFRANEDISLRTSTERVSCITTVVNKYNKKVNNLGCQTPPANSGFDSFEFFTPERRPAGENLAMTISPALSCFAPETLGNGYIRPYLSANAWVAPKKQTQASITALWPHPVNIDKIRLFFDTDSDHPMETVQWGHPESEMPFCIDKYTIYDDKDGVVALSKDNHQTINTITLKKTLKTSSLRFEFEKSHNNIPISLFAIDIR